MPKLVINSGLGQQVAPCLTSAIISGGERILPAVEQVTLLLYGEVNNHQNVRGHLRRHK